MASSDSGHATRKRFRAALSETAAAPSAAEQRRAGLSAAAASAELAVVARVAAAASRAGLADAAHFPVPKPIDADAAARFSLSVALHTRRMRRCVRLAFASRALGAGRGLSRDALLGAAPTGDWWDVAVAVGAASGGGGAGEGRVSGGDGGAGGGGGGGGGVFGASVCLPQNLFPSRYAAFGRPGALLLTPAAIMEGVVARAGAGGVPLATAQSSGDIALAEAAAIDAASVRVQAARSVEELFSAARGDAITAVDAAVANAVGKRLKLSEAEESGGCASVATGIIVDGECQWGDGRGGVRLFEPNAFKSTAGAHDGAPTPPPQPSVFRAPLSNGRRCSISSASISACTPVAPITLALPVPAARKSLVTADAGGGRVLKSSTTAAAAVTAPAFFLGSGGVTVLATAARDAVLLHPFSSPAHPPDDPSIVRTAPIFWERAIAPRFQLLSKKSRALVDGAGRLQRDRTGSFAASSPLASPRVSNEGGARADSGAGAGAGAGVGAGVGADQSSPIAIVAFAPYDANRPQFGAPGSLDSSSVAGIVHSSATGLSAMVSSASAEDQSAAGSEGGAHSSSLSSAAAHSAAAFTLDMETPCFRDLGEGAFDGDHRAESVARWRLPPVPRYGTGSGDAWRPPLSAWDTWPAPPPPPTRHAAPTLDGRPTPGQCFDAVPSSSLSSSEDEPDAATILAAHARIDSGLKKRMADVAAAAEAEERAAKEAAASHRPPPKERPSLAGTRWGSGHHSVRPGGAAAAASSASSQSASASGGRGRPPSGLNASGGGGSGGNKSHRAASHSASAARLSSSILSPIPDGPISPRNGLVVQIVSPSGGPPKTKTLFGAAAKSFVASQRAALEASKAKEGLGGPPETTADAANSA